MLPLPAGRLNTAFEYEAEVDDGNGFRKVRRMKIAIVILPLIACSSCNHPKEAVSARIEKEDGTITTESIEVVTIDGAKYLRFPMSHGFYGYCPKVNAVAENPKP